MELLILSTQFILKLNPTLILTHSFDDLVALSFNVAELNTIEGLLEKAISGLEQGQAVRKVQQHALCNSVYYCGFLSCNDESYLIVSSVQYHFKAIY